MDGKLVPWIVVLCNTRKPTSETGNWVSGVASWPKARLSDKMKSPVCHWKKTKQLKSGKKYSIEEKENIAHIFYINLTFPINRFMQQMKITRKTVLITFISKMRKKCLWIFSITGSKNKLQAKFYFNLLNKIEIYILENFILMKYQLQLEPKNGIRRGK